MSQSNQVKWVGIQPTNPLERVSITFDYVASQVSESVKDTDTIAGNVTLASTTVPSGETHCISHILAFNNVSAITSISVYHRTSATNYSLRRVIGPAADQEIIVATPIIITAGDDIRAYFVGCVLHDNIQLHIVGHKLNT